MRTFNQRIDGATRIDGTVTLPLELRRRSRLRARIDGGEEIGVVLPRGSVLRDGELLGDGEIVVCVRAAAEAVSTVRAPDPAALARACYHLGNRHVAVQIGDGWARYLHDHVLDAMVHGLGLQVVVERAPFEPEVGAYGGGHGHHDHEEAP